MASTVAVIQQLSPAAADELVYQVKIAFREANATRYLSAIGLVILLYDHLLTFPDEVNLVWRSRRSPANFAFLFNKYLVAICLIVVAYFMNHWSGAPISDTACRAVLGLSSVSGVISVATGDALVLQRIVALWDGNRTVKKTMACLFIATFLLTLASMVTTVTHVLPTVHFNPVVRICAPTEDSPFLPVVWATPMVYEVLALLFTCWNAIDRPRDSSTRLAAVLWRDGITFFLAVTALRTLNLTLALLHNPSLILLGVFFVWAGVTVVLNRSLLYIQHYEYTRFMQEVMINPAMAGVDSAPFRLSIEDAAAYIDEDDEDMELGCV